MKPQKPVHTLHLYPIIDKELVALLKSLPKEDWHKPTICTQWNVKDIAAHILDGCYLRRLSTCRDNYFGESPGKIYSYRDLVHWLNQVNADWVKAAKRLSPQMLISLIETKSNEVVEYFGTLDLEADALFPVAWAGENRSPNWFDIARDYSERWLHQQQIRLAVEKPGIMNRELYFPLLEIFMRALPHTYRDVNAAQKTILKFTVTSEAGGSWYLQKNSTAWDLTDMPESVPDAEVIIPAEIAWRVFSKGIDKEIAREMVTIKGDAQLGEVVLNMTSVMA